MKKVILALGVCFLFISLPSMTAISSPKMKNLSRVVNVFDKISMKSEDDMPSWVDGEFNGTWGLKEFFLLDMVEIEIGNISGYYGQILGPFYLMVGQFYPRWNESQITNITGVYFGPIIFGGLGEIDVETDGYIVSTSETHFAGIGDQNLTHFDWRIMGREGPTFYLKGNFSEFE